MVYVHLIGAEWGATNGPVRQVAFFGSRVYAGDLQIAALVGNTWYATEADGTVVPGPDRVLALVVSEEGIPPNASPVAPPSA